MMKNLLKRSIVILSCSAILSLSVYAEDLKPYTSTDIAGKSFKLVGVDVGTFKQGSYVTVGSVRYSLSHSWDKGLKRVVNKWSPSAPLVGKYYAIVTSSDLVLLRYWDGTNFKLHPSDAITLDSKGNASSVASKKQSFNLRDVKCAYIIDSVSSDGNKNISGTLGETSDLADLSNLISHKWSYIKEEIAAQDYNNAIKAEQFSKDLRLKLSGDVSATSPIYYNSSSSGANQVKWETVLTNRAKRKLIAYPEVYFDNSKDKVTISITGGDLWYGKESSVTQYTGYFLATANSQMSDTQSILDSTVPSDELSCGSRLNNSNMYEVVISRSSDYPTITNISFSGKVGIDSDGKPCDIKFIHNNVSILLKAANCGVSPKVCDINIQDLP